ncbi:hypothetical protein R5R35_004136 [Gryllus longicercus]|uniref:Uncharacterized protein n=1 Tax=Gryllus longicercus TaxID=2509291 RepID=A0AAN9Z3I4_9ORTH
MEEINILSESVIKIEPVNIKTEAIKEEPIDVDEDNCWNAFEELQPPIAVFSGPTVKQETFTSEDKGSMC